MLVVHKGQTIILVMLMVYIIVKLILLVVNTTLFFKFQLVIVIHKGQMGILAMLMVYAVVKLISMVVNVIHAWVVVSTFLLVKVTTIFYISSSYQINCSCRSEWAGLGTSKIFIVPTV